MRDQAAEVGDPVIPPPLIVQRRIGALVGFDDDALLDETADQRIERPGAEPDRAVGPPRDFLDDRVAMLLAVRQRDQHMEHARGQGQQVCRVPLVSRHIRHTIPTIDIVGKLRPGPAPGSWRCQHRPYNVGMSPALLSLLALLAAIVISFASRLNVGIAAIPLAWAVGAYAGQPAEAVLGGFPASLFVTLAGVTLLFALAEGNGTIGNLATRLAALASGRSQAPADHRLLHRLRDLERGARRHPGRGT